MNLLQLKTSTRYYLDDDSAARWEDPEITYYINRSCKYYWEMLVTHKYQGILKNPGATLNVTASVDYVALPTDFHTIEVAYWVYGNRKIPMVYFVNYDDVICTEATDNFVPSYSFRGSNLILNPPPLSSVTGGIYMDYYPEYTDLSGDTDTPTGFKAAWQDMVALKAACIAKAGREEEDVSTIKGMDLNELEAQFLSGLRMTHGRTRVNPYVPC